MKQSEPAIWKLLNEKKLTSPDSIIKAILQNRGISDIADFLEPPDPYLIPLSKTGISGKQVEKTIERLEKAKIQKEKIIIYGDYDADGITGTAILWETLYNLGFDAVPFIPNRDQHGYGLSEKGITAVCSQNTGEKPCLFITVDNGIVAIQAAEFLKSKKIDLIITDHHQKKQSNGKEIVPHAEAIIWSDLIAGCAVSWFLAREITKFYQKNLNDFKKSNSLELSAIGTIADMMPLVGVNRSLTFYGLKEMSKSKRIGLKAIFKEAVIENRELGSYDINFIIAPRLNAMGRIGEALESLRLLCTKDEARAVLLARKLGLTNKQRQDITFSDFEKSTAIVENEKQYNNKIIIIYNSFLNPGIAGLTAGRLSEKYNLPSLVMTDVSDVIKGSARSIPNFNLIEFLRRHDEYFIDLGGHPMAAGFSLKKENLQKLIKALISDSAGKIKNDLLQKKIIIDCQLDLADISRSLFEKLEALKPFGLGNSKPLFLAKNVKLADMSAVGREKNHLRLKIKEERGQKRFINCIGFNLGHMADSLLIEKKVDILFYIFENQWNGHKSLELGINDLKQS